MAPYELEEQENGRKHSIRISIPTWVLECYFTDRKPTYQPYECLKFYKVYGQKQKTTPKKHCNSLNLFKNLFQFRLFNSCWWPVPLLGWGFLDKSFPWFPSQHLSCQKQFILSLNNELFSLATVYGFLQVSHDWSL